MFDCWISSLEIVWKEVGKDSTDCVPKTVVQFSEGEYGESIEGIYIGRIALRG